MDTIEPTETQRQEALVRQLAAALLAGGTEIEALLRDRHPADIAGCLADLSDDEASAVLARLDTETRADVLAHVADIDEDFAEHVVEGGTLQELAAVVEEMDPDDAADLLAVVDDAKAEAILSLMGREQAEEVRALRRFEGDTAGGIMTTEYLVARPGETRKEIVARLKFESDEVETVQSIFVCGPGDRLLGAVHSRDLLTADPDTAARALMDRAIVTVSPGTDQEACANLMRKYDLAVLPVVDEQSRLLGMITHDDILDVVDDEAEEDMFRLVGVGDNKPLEHGAMERACKRLPWLAATLIGSGLISPLILHRYFETTLDRVVMLAFFIPVIMGISGNTAIQSSTIAVRGLATGEIRFGDIFWMLRRELTVAGIVAVVCALAIMAFVYAVSVLGFGPPPAVLSVARLVGVVGAAMFAGILVAVLLGTLMPMLCHRAGVDPALASGPFITTLIDISTQVIYLGLATWLLLA